MADVSRTTARKLANSSAVVSAIEVQGTSIAERAQAVLFPEGDVDLVAMVTQLGVRLKLVEDGLREAEAAYLAERTDNDAARAARDDADAALRSVMTRSKSMASGAYGDRYAARVGLGKALERRPDLFLAQARNAERLLSEVETPAAELGGGFDPAALATAIGAAATPLEEALRDIDREAREDQQAMIRRDEAAELWDRVYAATANMLVSLAQAAGDDALADRIRPTDRRRLGIDDPAPVEPSDPTTDTPTGPTEA